MLVKTLLLNRNNFILERKHLVRIDDDDDDDDDDVSLCIFKSKGAIQIRYYYYYDIYCLIDGWKIFGTKSKLNC